MVFKVSAVFTNIQYFWMFLDIQIIARPTSHCSIDNHFFSWLLLPETWFCFYFCWQLNMLIYFLWLKVYVAFKDLHNLKILLCECKMSFKIGSFNMCEIYYQTTKTISSPPSFCGEQCSVSNFEKGGSEKNECLGRLKEFLPQIFTCGGKGGGGLLCFLSRKKKGPISN